MTCRGQDGELPGVYRVCLKSRPGLHIRGHPTGALGGTWLRVVVQKGLLRSVEAILPGWGAVDSQPRSLGRLGAFRMFEGLSLLSVFRASSG